MDHLDLSEMKKVAREKATELLTLAGPCVDPLCGICGKKTSDHVGGVITGCMDKEIGDEALKQLLRNQIMSFEDTIGRLRAASSLSHQVGALGQKITDLVTEKEALARVISDKDNELAERNSALSKEREKLSDTEVEHEGNVIRIMELWTDYLTGGMDGPTLARNIQSEFA